jgi:hypothetical protein
LPPDLSAAIVELFLSTILRARIYVAPFKVQAGAVFISNKNFDNPKDFSARIWRTQIPALKSRTCLITLPFDIDACREYTHWIAPQVLRDTKIRDRNGFDKMLSEQARLEVLNHFDENWHRYPEVSPRKIGMFAKLRIKHPNLQRWLAIVESQLLAA